MDQRPDKNLAKGIIADNFSSEIVKLERFTTGLCHYVYDIKLADKAEYVLRISRWDAGLNGGVYWNKKLKELGIPVPNVIRHDSLNGFLYSIHDRLPGKDLWFLYDDLSSKEKQLLATELASYQTKVGENIKSQGCGWATSLQDPVLTQNRCWSDIIQESISGIEYNIGKAGIFAHDYVDKVKKVLSGYEEYFKCIGPDAFMDDITNKNVLLENNRLSGIVDTDEIAFGDKLFHLGLTKMALISQKSDTDYIEYFKESYGITGQQSKIIDVYTLLFCACFMGEIGQRFNKDEIVIDKEKVEYLEEVFNRQLRNLK